MRVTVAERIEKLTPVQAREYFTWRDAGLSMEAALGRVEQTQQITVRESDDGSEYDHLFGTPIREAATSINAPGHESGTDDDPAEYIALYDQRG